VTLLEIELAKLPADRLRELAETCTAEHVRNAARAELKARTAHPRKPT